MGKRLAVGCPFEDEIIQGSVDYTHLEAIRKSLPFYEDRDKFNWE
jgi:hypothetical protein